MEKESSIGEREQHYCTHCQKKTTMRHIEETLWWCIDGQHGIDVVKKEEPDQCSASTD